MCRYQSLTYRIPGEDESWVDQKFSLSEAAGIAGSRSLQIKNSYLGPKDMKKDRFGGGIWKDEYTWRFIEPKNEEQEEEYKKYMAQFWLESSH